MIKNNRTLVEAMKNERKSFDERIKSTKKSADWLQIYAQIEMENGGLDEYKSTKHQAKIKMNPPKVSIENAEKLITWLKTNNKQKFLKFKDPEIDKQLIKEAIKNGEEMPFVSLIQEERLEVK